MSEQLSLTGFDVAPRPTDRLFFALLPDAEAAGRIAKLAQQLRGEHGLRGKPLASERLHVTLHHLGDYAGLPQGVVAAAAQAAASVNMPPFKVTFDRAASFAGRRESKPFVLLGGDRNAELMAFQQALGRAMTAFGLGRLVEPRFTPHLTLLYDRLAVAERCIESIAWRVQEFVLLRSLLGRSEYVQLGCWQLRARS